MRFHHELTYDASPEDVYAMLSDPRFRERAVEAQLGRDYTVTIEPAGGAMTVSVDQKRPTDNFPGFAKKFVGDSIHVVQSETWSDHTNAVLEVTIPGKPGRLNATITIADTTEGDDPGAMEVVDGDLKVSVPLVGGKLESLVSELLREALDVEQEVGRAWLAGDR